MASPATERPKEATRTTVDYYVRPGSDASESKALIKNFSNLFPETEHEIYNLLTWAEGWDGYDTPKPNPASVREARSWAEGLYRDVSRQLWIKPRVSADEDGDVSFEWWKGQKKITIYISPEAVDYIKVEKAGPSLEMEDGSIKTSEERLALWNWLIS